MKPIRSILFWVVNSRETGFAGMHRKIGYNGANRSEGAQRQDFASRESSAHGLCRPAEVTRMRVLHREVELTG